MERKRERERERGKGHPKKDGGERESALRE